MKLHFPSLSHGRLGGGQTPWFPPTTPWQQLSNCAPLLAASSRRFTWLAQASQLIKLGLSVPQTHTTHISLLPPPPPAGTHEAHAFDLDGRATLPLQCSPALGTALEADCGESCMSLLILLLHSPELQSTDNWHPCDLENLCSTSILVPCDLENLCSFLQDANLFLLGPLWKIEMFSKSGDKLLSELHLNF